MAECFHLQFYFQKRRKITSHCRKQESVMLTFLLAFRQVFLTSWLTCAQRASVFMSVFKLCTCSVSALTQTALLRHKWGSVCVCVISGSVFMLCLETWVVPIEEDEETVDLPSALRVGGVCTYACLFARGPLCESKEQHSSSWYFLETQPVQCYCSFSFSLCLLFSCFLPVAFPSSSPQSSPSQMVPPTQWFVLCLRRAESLLVSTCRGLPTLHPPTFSVAPCTTARIYPAHVSFQGVLGKTYPETWISTLPSAPWQSIPCLPVPAREVGIIMLLWWWGVETHGCRARTRPWCSFYKVVSTEGGGGGRVQVGHSCGAGGHIYQ